MTEFFAHLLMGFLSTPSARRATETAGANGLGVKISIHALREEGDQGGRQSAL